ncbi:MAG: polysaccharide biosynthesis tyrosine autokinase [Clostridiales bacterium]|nr:polysaccharide biosynthesis tyrosine autokinase [Clostridiales bacterium]
MEGFKAKKTGIEINLSYLFRTISKKWWIVALVAVLLGGIGGVIIEKESADKYSSTMAFVVNNKSNNNTSDITTSIKMANTYARILSGKTLANMVCELTKFDATDVKDSIETTCTPESNIIELTVTYDSPDSVFTIAKAIAQCYTTVVDSVGFENSTLTICEQPERPTKPIDEHLGLKYGVVIAFIGAVMAMVVILIIETARDTVQSVETIQERLDMNIFGVVQKVQRKDKHSLIVDRGMNFFFNESFKMMRTKLERIAQTKGYKKFMVTSTVSSEGKTTVSVNLAISLAENGASVLLVDADLRVPAVCKFFDIDNISARGLGDVISGKISAGKAIKYLEKYNLFILAGKESTKNSSEVLSKGELGKIIKTIENEFDYIIFDTTPAGIVTDSVIIGRNMDAALFVIGENEASVSQISYAISNIADSGVDILGCVYNGATTDSVNPYGYMGRSLYSKKGRGYYSKYESAGVDNRHLTN